MVEWLANVDEFLLMVIVFVVLTALALLVKYLSRSSVDYGEYGKAHDVAHETRSAAAVKISAEEETEQKRKAQVREYNKREKERERANILAQVPSGPLEPGSVPPAELVYRAKKYEIDPYREFRVGKLEGENELVMHDPSVSRRHCKIRAHGGEYVLYDLGSTHHTFVNNLRCTRRILKDGDQIKVGPDVITFRINDEE